MKKSIIILFVIITGVFCINRPLQAQKLYFCEDVDDAINPVTTGDTFYIGEDGGYFFFLVHLPYSVGCTSVEYRIYEINDDFEETFHATITQTGMSMNWDRFYKKVIFYEPGLYAVYVVDCNENELVSDTVLIKRK